MTVASKSTALARRAGALTGCTPDELERVAEALFASMVQPAWVIDRATLRFVAVNDAALALYGYSRKEFLALTIDAIRPAEDRPRLRAHMATDNGVGPHPRGRWRHYTKEGRLFPVEVTRHHLRWDGRPASLAVITDITQQDAVAEQLRRHESALRATHDLFHSVMESGSDPIFIKDLGGKYLLTNTAECAVLGLTPDQMIGRTDVELFPPEEARVIREADAEVQRRNAPLVYEQTVGTAKGPRTFLITKSPRRDVDGNVIGVIGMSKDITDRRVSDETIRRLTVAVEQSPAAVTVTDLRGNIDYVNRRFTAITGYAAAEVLGKNPRFLKSGLTPPETYRELWTTILAGREWTGLVQNRRKDGELYWESATISPIRDAAGTLTHFVEISQDVTAQRLLEEQFRQAQKMEAVGRLAGGVAHDFNNLLSVITSCTELVLEDFGASDPRREDLEEVRKAAVQAASLTRQLLAFSRQQVLQPRVLDLNDVVGGAERMLRRLIGEDVTLTTVFGAELGAVKADQGQIEQVIMNLAVNARDAMPTGGKLTIATSVLHLDDEYADGHVPVPAGYYVLLTMTDTGVGMDATTQRRIFEPFFTTKERGKGTGLGLATVYGIVKQSGGFIWVYSEPGRGTTFKVYLPRVEAPVGGEPEPPATIESLRGTETVLIAEDSDAVRKVSREVLERHGYTVLDAPDGKAALELAVWHSTPIHLLLTDVVMPEMSGRELADHLTQLRPDVRVLYFSGYTDDAIVRHGVLEEGIAYLEKPFTPDQLARKVREVLDAGRGS